MLSRVHQLARHLLPPSRSFVQTPRRPSSFFKMATAQEKSQRTIHTAACLIIGDEVLGGKTVDTNSAYFAKWCFSLGINLKRIEVIEDDEGEIKEAVSRMSDRYDFVVTSGGIGPTHDDITYQSIANAFNLPLKLYPEAFERMKKLSKTSVREPGFDWEADSPALQAKLRMVRLPTDDSRPLSDQFLFVSEDLWVPIAVVNGNIYILPGVPSLFQNLLTGLKPHVAPRLVDPDGKGTCRVLISTPMTESAVAAYLTELAAKVESKGVKVGSYPRWGKQRNTVTLVGRDREFIESLIPEVENGVQGNLVSQEDEFDHLKI